MKRFGSKVNNFWEPGYEPESDKTAFKPKDVDKECFIFCRDKSEQKQNADKSGAYGKYKVGCGFLVVVVSILPHVESIVKIKRFKVRDPVTNSVLKLKKLVKVKFIPIDDTISDTKRQAAKARWKVRHPTFDVNIKFQNHFL